MKRFTEDCARNCPEPPSSLLDGEVSWLGEEDLSGPKEGLEARVGNLICCGVEFGEKSSGGTLYTLLIKLNFATIYLTQIIFIN